MFALKNSIVRGSSQFVMCDTRDIFYWIRNILKMMKFLIFKTDRHNEAGMLIKFSFLIPCLIFFILRFSFTFKKEVRVFLFSLSR